MDVPTVDPIERLRERRSAKWRTHPADVLPLTVAETDFNLARPIRAVLDRALDLSDVGYGVAEPELGRALADFAGRRWDWTIDPGSVAVATDVSTAVVHVLRLFVRPGDSVVISPPVYAPFPGWVREVDARLVEAPLRYDEADGWRLDLDALEAAFAGRPAAYLLCNPHNPVGRVHSPEELAALVELAARYDVTVVSDEIHAPLVLPGAQFTPLLTVPGAADLAVSLHSASKAWNLAGLKCAAIVAGSDRMRAALDELPADLRWRIGHFGVIATVAAYTDGGPWLDLLLADLDARRSQLATLLRDNLPSVNWHPPEATFLAWLDCQALGDPSPQEQFLSHGVALEPGASFGAGGERHVRLNFGTSATILEEALTRMAHAAK
ncbi:aminotransferase class I/II-fold pyridoxal phosphate-dependent enzyme [Streptomyces sp. SID13031]|nr:aminotransferase class I/II-fold pyridoxal phosphate-dependent enzyme [Streptomyces sp. SID13031]NEA36843.1 aminotransferase class I/II-fold pyridoxal phosphate-dependent enzyme [Streptomyces sp. SID13031]